MFPVYVLSRKRIEIEKRMIKNSLLLGRVHAGFRASLSTLVEIYLEDRLILIKIQRRVQSLLAYFLEQTIYSLQAGVLRLGLVKSREHKLMKTTLFWQLLKRAAPHQTWAIAFTLYWQTLLCKTPESYSRKNLMRQSASRRKNNNITYFSDICTVPGYEVADVQKVTCWQRTALEELYAQLNLLNSINRKSPLRDKVYGISLHDYQRLQIQSKVKKRKAKRERYEPPQLTSRWDGLVRLLWKL